MKSLRVLTVLGLVLVLVYSQVQGLPTQGLQETKNCGSVLRPEELHKVGGAWVLVFLTYDRVKSEGRSIPHMGSSHLEVQVHQDNHTFSIHEDTMVFGRCAVLTYNLTFSQSGADVQQLHLHKSEMSLDGRMFRIDERGTLHVLSFSQNTFTVLFKNKNSDEEILLTFRREGLDEGDLQKDLVEHRVKAECLGLSGETFEDWKYNSGCDGLCHKPPTVGPEQLRQMVGDWVVVLLTYDKVKSRQMSLDVLSSSLISIEASPENDTAIVHEKSLCSGRCFSYPYNITVSGSGVQQLHVHKTEVVVDGRLVKIQEEAQVQVLRSSPNSMSLIYKGVSDQVLLLGIYRRRGHHEGDLEPELVEHNVKAQCLGLHGPTTAEWRYDGTSDFCPRP